MADKNITDEEKLSDDYDEIIGEQFSEGAVIMLVAMFIVSIGLIILTIGIIHSLITS